MVEHEEPTSQQSGSLMTALREMIASKAAESDEAVHYVPGDSLVGGGDVVDTVCTHEHKTVAG